MALINLRTILDYAAENNFGIPAFNINNLEQMQAILTAAETVNAPVIIQVSQGGRKYAGNKFLSVLMKAAIENYPNLPICFHQDHASSPKICYEAMQLGFTSVMMDGSLLEDMKTPSDFQYNVRTTSEVVTIAHKRNISVEGELGCLGSLETLTADKEDGSGAEGELTKKQLLTDPNQAKEFVELTKVDALAIAIGTSHGAYKFSKPPSDDLLAISQLIQINKKIPNTHLVMHGSSSVPQNLLEKINNNGGAIKKTYGVPVTQIQIAIKHGVRKINIDTDLRLAATAAIREYLIKNPDQFDPRNYLLEARKAQNKICQEHYINFGAAEHASKLNALCCKKNITI